ncbi:hypothetical protein [Kiloniella sp.]|uniref:hypothetical protein n=1 Tax=Kiloniella sp. TaxID=1938587 RepID=UPI003A91EAFD
MPSYILVKAFPRKPFKEQYIADLVHPIRKQGKDNHYIDQSVIIQIDRNEIMTRVEKILRRYKKYDLNQDTLITEEELKKWLYERVRNKSNKPQHKVENIIKKEIDTILSVDSNADRIIDQEEARKAAQENALARPLRNSKKLITLLTLDPNKDGKLTVNELLGLGLDAFEFYDINRDTILDIEELKLLNETKKLLQKRQYQQKERDKQLVRVAACDIPDPDSHDDIFVIGTRKGSAISTVSVAGQHQETTTGTIEIEPGEGNLYIYAISFDAMIWQIKGATHRIAHLVLAAKRTDSGVGAIGIPKEKITFVSEEKCIRYFDKHKEDRAKEAQQFVKDKFGRHATNVVGGYKVNRLVLPSLATSKSPEDSYEPGKRYLIKEEKEDAPYYMENGKKKKIEEIWAKNLPQGSKAHPETVGLGRFFTPDGVANLDHASIVTSKSAEKYLILPGYAGLIQLMEQGKIERISYKKYKIVSEFEHFPAELAGGRAVNFILPEGISIPVGDPGHSCVYDEKTEKPLAGPKVLCNKTDKAPKSTQPWDGLESR